MRDDELKQLLHAADSGAISSPVNLHSRVRHKQKTRRLRNSALAALLIVSTCSVALWWHEKIPTIPSRMEIAVNLDALKQQADMLTAKAELLEAEEQIAQAQSKLYAVQSRREQTATILLQQCKWLQSHDGDARQEYMNLASEFADTHAGVEAQHKLSERKEG